jgi:hypothetical protein
MAMEIAANRSAAGLDRPTILQDAIDDPELLYGEQGERALDIIESLAIPNVEPIEPMEVERQKRGRGSSRGPAGRREKRPSSVIRNSPQAQAFQSAGAQAAQNVERTAERVARELVQHRVPGRRNRIKLRDYCKRVEILAGPNMSTAGIKEAKKEYRKNLKLAMAKSKLEARCFRSQLKKLKPKRRLPKNPDKRVAKVQKMLAEAELYRARRNAEFAGPRSRLEAHGPRSRMRGRHAIADARVRIAGTGAQRRGDLMSMLLAQGFTGRTNEAEAMQV